MTPTSLHPLSPYGAWIEKLRKHNLGEYGSDFIPNTKLCLLVDLCGIAI